MTNKKAPRRALFDELDTRSVSQDKVLGHVHGNENHQEHQNAAYDWQHDGHHGHDGFDNVLLGAVFWFVVGHGKLSLRV
jgi:hypothetical protein